MWNNNRKKSKKYKTNTKIKLNKTRKNKYLNIKTKL